MMATASVIHGEALTTLLTLPDASVDCVVTDPPAGISFMGKEWDDFRRARNPADAGRDNVFGRTSRTGPEYGRRKREGFIAFLTPIMAEALRVAKPGAVALVWAIPRTSHWTATALEDAGWLIEDRIAHIQAQGFPKHHSKLKPACEDWWLCRKPGPKWLGVEECRIGAKGGCKSAIPYQGGPSKHCFGVGLNDQRSEQIDGLGRYPANLTLTCCGNDPHDEDCAARMLDEQSGERPSRAGRTKGLQNSGRHGGIACFGRNPMPGTDTDRGYGNDTGGASRFFYVAKASRSDRGEGNNHPTVKSTALMRWLVRLACPAGGTVLDPFTGSGSTGVACLQEGRSFIGIEQSEEYVAIARKRLKDAEAQHPLFAGV